MIFKHGAAQVLCYCFFEDDEVLQGHVPRGAGEQGAGMMPPGGQDSGELG